MTTPANGNVLFSPSSRTHSTDNTDISEGLGEGTYELLETVAPAGYALHSGAVRFVVSGGLLTILDSPNPSAAGVVADSIVTNGSTKTLHYAESNGIKTCHFVFENTAGTELPGTGTVFGLSRMGFASLGTVLLAAFVVVYQYKKRRQYNGEDEE